MVSCKFCEIGWPSKYKRQMYMKMLLKKVHICFVYDYVKLDVIKKTCLLQMLQNFYNVIEDRKYYYSDPIYRAFD